LTGTVLCPRQFVGRHGRGNVTRTLSMKLRSTNRPAVAVWHGDENHVGFLNAFGGAAGER